MSDEKEMPDATYDKSFYRDMKTVGSKTDRDFFGHAQIKQTDCIKNPAFSRPTQKKDGFYNRVQNCEGKL